MAELSPTVSTAAPTPIAARLEITLKFTEIPETVPGPNGWRTFALTANERVVRVTVRPKMWTKLEEASKTWGQWTAVVRGKFGPATVEGFELADASLEVFERKEKASKDMDVSKTS